MVSPLSLMLDRRWWQQREEKDLCAALLASVKIAMDRDRARIDYYRVLARLYDEHDRHSVFWAPTDGEDYRVPRNNLRRICDTAYNRVTAVTPRPFYCSDGGDADLRYRLEMLNTAVTGLFLAHAVDRKANLAQKHAEVFGNGAVKVSAVTHTKRPRVVVERVYPWEIFTDPLDAAYGEPRVLYQVRWVDRAQLYSMWPGHAVDIKDAPTDRPEWTTITQQLADPVRVVEAWYLDREGDGKGRHVIALENVILLDEEYEYDAFPVVIFRHEDPLVGFWSDGLAHQLAGQQAELNDISGAISETIKLGAWPAVLVEKNSEVESGHLDNTPMRVVKYKGIPPQIQTAQGLTGEARQYAESVSATMYQTSGVSEFAASSTKPAGLQSGRSLRIFADQQDGNLRDTADHRAQSYLALGLALIRAQRAVAEVDPGALVIFTDPQKRTTQAIRWKDVDLTDEGLQLVAAPVSVLPTTPAAKMATLEEMANAGILTPEEFREEMDLPDIKALNGPATAPRRLIERQMLAMLRDGIPQRPEPFFPPVLPKLIASQHYCQGVLDGAAEDRLELVRQYIQMAVDQEKAVAQQDQPPPAPEGAVPSEALPPDGVPVAPPEMMQ